MLLLYDPVVLIAFSTGPEAMAKVRHEYLRLRNQTSPETEGP